MQILDILFIISIIIILVTVMPNITEAFTQSTDIEQSSEYQNRIQMFKDIIEVLNDYHIPYWADFGTLLGLIREGGLIQHDDDTDICVHIDDVPLLLQEWVQSDLAKRGLRLTKSINRTYKVYQIRDLPSSTAEDFYCEACPHMDIFVYENIKDCLVRRCYPDQKQKWKYECHDLIKRDSAPLSIFGIKRSNWSPIKFRSKFALKFFPKLDLIVRVPKNAKRLLIHRYGNDYMTPKKGFKGMFKGCSE